MNIIVIPNANTLNEMVGVSDARCDEITSTCARICADYMKQEKETISLQDFLTFALPQADSTNDAEVFLYTSFLHEGWIQAVRVNEGLESLLGALRGDHNEKAN